MYTNTIYHFRNFTVRYIFLSFHKFIKISVFTLHNYFVFISCTGCIKKNATRENNALSKNNQKHFANIFWGKGIRHYPIFNIHSYFTMNGHIFLLFLEYVEEIGGKKWAILHQHAIAMILHN